MEIDIENDIAKEGSTYESYHRLFKKYLTNNEIFEYIKKTGADK